MLLTGFMLFLGRDLALCQQNLTLPDAPEPQQWKTERSSDTSEYRQHHIMWVIPNYRTDEGATEFQPLTPEQKFKLAFDDSFDPTAFLVAGVFASSSMAQKSISFLRKRCEGLRQVLRWCICRSGHWQCDDRSHNADRPTSRSPLFHQRRGWFLEADRVRGQPGIHHSQR